MNLWCHPRTCLGPPAWRSLPPQRPWAPGPATRYPPGAARRVNPVPSGILALPLGAIELFLEPIQTLLELLRAGFALVRARHDVRGEHDEEFRLVQRFRRL